MLPKKSNIIILISSVHPLKPLWKYHPIIRRINLSFMIIQKSGTSEKFCRLFKLSIHHIVSLFSTFLSASMALIFVCCAQIFLSTNRQLSSRHFSIYRNLIFLKIITGIFWNVIEFFKMHLHAVLLQILGSGKYNFCFEIILTHFWISDALLHVGD